MPIALIIIGVALVAFSDKLQPDHLRKPKLNFYMGSLGGILWLSGVMWAFFSYKLSHAILLLIGSFILGAVLGVKK